MKVSEEVKQSYLENKANTKMDKISWSELKASPLGITLGDIIFYSVVIIDNIIAIILTLTLIGTITDSIESTLTQIIVGMFIIITIYGILSALIPILVHKAVSPGWRYTEWNESYYIRLPGEENYKYYSKWYLDLLGVKEFYYKRDSGEEVKEKNISWAFQAEVKRPEDVNHWKNQLLTNRPLTILEYKKLKKLDKESEIRKQEDLEEYKQYNSN
ncbi:ribulose-1;5-bisphosphate carboxylase/oxygenase small subunit [Staphylococcus phage JD007]|uniref:Membrane protein n=1 Tax=Staphylococcus phage JD007 TaxID=1239383 RepID=K7QNJ7_9CAUD|nr:ribulose-1;5-bisphosphate carboxylase/oxygenase small subunit [Staphylococcus phage JD007]AFV50850.1 membrane protein [Staphylococcus phage JD007]